MSATHVYANGHEIACKAAGSSGVSSSATPDPCWSPPAPTAGPLVIPYPNTCFADSIVKGTCTVMILSQTVAIADKSSFSTSIGNEGATQAFAKGVATGKIKGRAYFAKWSPDVVFEGFGVPRDMDLVSHNHGSMPANTPTFPYLSRRNLNLCGGEAKRIERACAPESEESDTKKALKKRSRLRTLLRPQPKPKKRNWHWTDDHCDGLEMKISDPEKAMDYVNQIKKAAESLPSELNLMSALEQELMEMATRAGAKALAGWAAKAGVKQVAGTSLPAVGNALMAIWSVVDAVVAIGDVAEIRRVATESLEQLKVLKAKVRDIGSLAEDFKNFDKLSPEAKLKKAQSIGTTAQDLLATLNPCTRARRCMLTPYDADTLKQRGRAHSNNKGCCDGQTGHHLIYGAMMKDGACTGYDKQAHKDAPTVCVEGTSQNFGSHGRIHDNMDVQVAKLARNGKILGGSMKLDDALDAAARSHSEAFPSSLCSEACIRKQMEDFYKSKCPDAKVRAVNKNGNKVEGDGGEIN